MTKCSTQWWTDLYQEIKTNFADQVRHNSHSNPKGPHKSVKGGLVTP